MKRGPSDPEKIPLDHILFRGGTDLTMFQSIGLVVIGLAFIIFVGLPIFIYQYIRPEQRDFRGMFVCGGVTIWGLVMIVNGVIAIRRRLTKTDRGSE
jgi:hypothetical protein